MKQIKYTLFVFFNVFGVFVFSQGEYVVQIDNVSGAYTNTGPAIAGITYIYPDERAFNENAGIFIFPSSNVNHSLYSIDVSNGSIINNPVINNIWTFQFDNSSGVLYGISSDLANNVTYFVSIDPATGAYTQIGGSIQGSSRFSMGGDLSAYDNSNHTYMFLAPPNILYSINATNGTVLSNPALSTASGENIINFTFDNSAGILYGLLHDNNANKYFLVTIDPANGAYTRIGSGITTGIGGGSITIDEANQKCFCLYSDHGYKITTIDIATGNATNNALIEAVNGNDNFLSIKYDNVHGKLYSIHWKSNTTGIEESNSPDNVVNVFPNPFSTQVTLRTSKILKNASLIIYNLPGQNVKQIDNLSGQTISLQRNDLPSGLYFVQLTQDGKTISVDKLVITDN